MNTRLRGVVADDRTPGALPTTPPEQRHQLFLLRDALRWVEECRAGEGRIEDLEAALAPLGIRAPSGGCKTDLLELHAALCFIEADLDRRKRELLDVILARVIGGVGS